MRRRLFEALAELANEVSDALTTPDPVTESSPRAPATPDCRVVPQSAPGHDVGPWDEPTLSPFNSPETAVLRTPMDAVNCGEYSFTLYNVQLIVSMLGTGGGVGGEYDVSRVPLHVWTGLTGRGGSPLPVIVFRDHGSLSVQVGNVPMTPGPDAPPTR